MTTAASTKTSSTGNAYMTSSMESRFHLPLRACCDDGYGVLVDEDSGKAPVKEQVETQLVEAGELDAAAERVKKEEEAREGQEGGVWVRCCCQFVNIKG